MDFGTVLAQGTPLLFGDHRRACFGEPASKAGILVVPAQSHLAAQNHGTTDVAGSKRLLPDLTLRVGIAFGHNCSQFVRRLFVRTREKFSRTQSAFSQVNHAYRNHEVLRQFDRVALSGERLPTPTVPSTALGSLFFSYHSRYERAASRPGIRENL
jgi:hypothetical protein